MNTLNLKAVIFWVVSFCSGFLIKGLHGGMVGVTIALWLSLIVSFIPDKEMRKVR